MCRPMKVAGFLIAFSVSHSDGVISPTILMILMWWFWFVCLFHLNTQICRHSDWSFDAAVAERRNCGGSDGNCNGSGNDGTCSNVCGQQKR